MRMPPTSPQQTRADCQPAGGHRQGGSTGNLKRSLQTIYDTVNTIVIAVRVADGADAAELTSNIIGTIKPDGSYTGLKALERAAPVTGVKPRILCVPDNCTLAVATALAGAAEAARLRLCADHCRHRRGGARLPRELLQPRTDADPRRLDRLGHRRQCQHQAGCLPQAAAMRALIDKEIGWHKTLSNVGVTGVDGMTKGPVLGSARPRYRGRPAQRQRNHRPDPRRWFPLLGQPHLLG